MATTTNTNIWPAEDDVEAWDLLIWLEDVQDLIEKSCVCGGALCERCGPNPLTG